VAPPRENEIFLCKPARACCVFYPAAENCCSVPGQNGFFRNMLHTRLLISAVTFGVMIIIYAFPRSSPLWPQQ